MIQQENITQPFSIQERILPLHAIRSSEELRTATQDFEGLFLQKLLDIMQEGLGKNDVLYSKQEGIWRSLLNEEYAKEFAKAGGIGLADMLYDYLAPLVLQEETTQEQSIKGLEQYKKAMQYEEHIL